NHTHHSRTTHTTTEPHTPLQNHTTPEPHTPLQNHTHHYSTTHTHISLLFPSSQHPSPSILPSQLPVSSPLVGINRMDASLLYYTPAQTRTHTHTHTPPGRTWS